MKKLISIASLTLALGGSSAFAATIGYESSLVGPSPTEVSYTLTLPDFNPALGTLTGVTIYFYATETSSSFSIRNTSGANVTANDAAQVNVSGSFANSASSADKFLGETLTIFDTGIGAGLGSCSTGGTPAPGTCMPITVAAGATNQYGPITVQNTNAIFGLTTGTGLLGLTGVDKSFGDVSNYVGGGTFALSGVTVNSNTTANDGGNFQVTQVSSATFRAEVDYTYTPPSTTPEPATMTLFGSALLGIGFFARKRIAKK
jgi:hypothetical protein